MTEEPEVFHSCLDSSLNLYSHPSQIYSTWKHKLNVNLASLLQAASWNIILSGCHLASRMGTINCYHWYAFVPIFNVISIISPRWQGMLQSHVLGTPTSQCAWEIQGRDKAQCARNCSLIHLHVFSIRTLVIETSPLCSEFTAKHCPWWRFYLLCRL